MGAFDIAYPKLCCTQTSYLGTRYFMNMGMYISDNILSLLRNDIQTHQTDITLKHIYYMCTTS